VAVVGGGGGSSRWRLPRRRRLPSRSLSATNHRGGGRPDSYVTQGDRRAGCATGAQPPSLLGHYNQTRSYQVRIFALFYEKTTFFIFLLLNYYRAAHELLNELFEVCVTHEHDVGVT
jgi:hypothetical protein